MIQMAFFLFAFSASASSKCFIPADPLDLSYEVEIQGSKAIRDSSIIYGNKDVGYFRAPVEKNASGHLSFRVIPVTYKKPIEFLLDKSRLRFSKHFSSPLSCYEQKVRLDRKMSNPFFYMSWVSRNEVGHQHYFPSIINRVGELVWAQTGASGPQNENYHYAARALDGGLLVLSQYVTSKLMKFSFKSGLKLEIPLAERVPRVFAHHSFAPVGNNQVAILSAKHEHVPIYRDYFFSLGGFLRAFKLFFEGRRIFVGSELLLLNFETKEIKNLYSSFDHFSTRKDVPLPTEDDPPVDPFLESKNLDKELLGHPKFDAIEKAHVDWSHENSVDFDPDKG